METQQTWVWSQAGLAKMPRVWLQVNAAGTYVMTCVRWRCIKVLSNAIHCHVLFLLYGLCSDMSSNSELVCQISRATYTSCGSMCSRREYNCYMTPFLSESLLVSRPKRVPWHVIPAVQSHDLSTVYISLFISPLRFYCQWMLHKEFLLTTRIIKYWTLKHLISQFISTIFKCWQNCQRKFAFLS